MACSTCHVILEDDVYDKLEEPDDDENVRLYFPGAARQRGASGLTGPSASQQDMLDLAFGLTDTCVPLILGSDSSLD